MSVEANAQRLIVAALERAGGVRKLAKELGIGHSTVSGWTSGSVPNVIQFDRLLEYLGGDIGRAMPDWEPESASRVPVVGTVQAGAMSPTPAETDEHVDLPDGPWRQSIYWTHTTGPVVYIRVRGDSMEPDFADGSWIAARRPASQKLPLGTPVVIRIGDEMTFKLLFEIKIRGVPMLHAKPINRAHRDIFVEASADVHVDYVALGVIHPFRRGYDLNAMQPITSNLVMRENPK